MATVVRESNGDLGAILKFNITPEDYMPKVNDELKKYRKQANLKGFRQGKAPISFVKKMYGKQVLGGVVNEVIEGELSKYLMGMEEQLLGQALPLPDLFEGEFDLKSEKGFTFGFEIGYAAPFEIKGLEEATSVTKYKINIPDSMVDEDLTNARKRMGEQTFPTESIEDMDVVEVSAKELEAEGGSLKKGGVEATFKLNLEFLTDDAKATLTKLKLEDTFSADVYTLEKDKDAAYVNKYMLDVAEDATVGNFFEFTITEVSRVALPEVNDELFAKMFPDGSVKNEEAYREKSRKEIEGFYDKQARNFAAVELQDLLINMNDFDLPVEFLKKWMLQADEKSTPEMVEKEFDAFIYDLRWRLVKGKFAKANDIKVEPTDIQNEIKNQFRQYMGGVTGDPEMEARLDQMAAQFAQSEEGEQQAQKIYENIMADRVFDKALTLVTLVEEEIDSEPFFEKHKAFVAARNARLKPETEAVEA